jgi:hypothetical protein
LRVQACGRELGASVSIQMSLHCSVSRHASGARGSAACHEDERYATGCPHELAPVAPSRCTESGAATTSSPNHHWRRARAPPVYVDRTDTRQRRRPLAARSTHRQCTAPSGGSH